MKKIYTRILALILMCLLAFTAVISVGCGSDEEDKSQDQTQSQLPNHVTETDEYLIKDYVSEYKIVYSAKAEAGSYDYFAMTELQHFIKEATGCYIPAVTDSGLTYSEDARYLSVGDTEILKTSGIEINYNGLKTQGYILKSKGNSVFFEGKLAGTMYAVYRFLQEQFDYAIYAVDEIKIEKTGASEKLNEYDIVCVPDVDIVANTSSETLEDDIYGYRMGLFDIEEVLAPQGGVGGTWHNFYGAVPEETYKSVHPEWFSNGQLNLSCETWKELAEVVLIDWQWRVASSDEKAIGITFTQMDENSWSNAPSSMALKEKYGVHSAEYIQFVNYCAGKMDEWMAENYPDREIFYGIFAYQQTLNAPVKMDENGIAIKDENGNYMPADDSVILADNVVVMYCPSKGSYYYDLQDESEKELYEEFKKWQVISNGNQMWYWSYTQNYNSMLTPIDISNRLQSDFKVMKEMGVEFALYGMNETVATIPTISVGWGRLRDYLAAKLRWNVNYDVEEITNEWFENYFKEAAPAMRKFYEEERMHYRYILTQNPNLSVPYLSEGEMSKKKYWPETVLNKWLDYCQEAEQAIAHLETRDNELYNKIKDRIYIESASVRYLLIKNYSDSYGENAKQVARDVMNNLIRIGVIYVTNDTLTRDYFASYV